MPKRGSGRNGSATLNEKGYVRLWVRPHRGRYAHRIIMSTLCLEFCYYPLSPTSNLPVGFTIEHIDHNITHNCPGNLHLLQSVIHNFCSSWTKVYRNNTLDDWDAEAAGPYAAYTEDELDETPF